ILERIRLLQLFPTVIPWPRESSRDFGRRRTVISFSTGRNSTPRSHQTWTRRPPRPWPIPRFRRASALSVVRSANRRRGPSSQRCLNEKGVRIRLGPLGHQHNGHGNEQNPCSDTAHSRIYSGSNHSERAWFSSRRPLFKCYPPRTHVRDIEVLKRAFECRVPEILSESSRF